MGVLAKLRAKLKRPSEPLADEYTAVGYKERAKRIKWQQRKQKLQKVTTTQVEKVRQFGEGFLKGAGMKAPKKPSAKALGQKLGKSLKKATKPKKVSTRNRTARPPSWDIGTGLFDTGGTSQLPAWLTGESTKRKKTKKRGRRRKNDDIPWWLK